MNADYAVSVAAERDRGTSKSQKPARTPRIKQTGLKRTRTRQLCAAETRRFRAAQELRRYRPTAADRPEIG